MPNGADKFFIYSELNTKAPGDPAALTLNGIPRAMEDHYQNAVKKATWFAYNGMWRAAGSGIIRGMAIAATITLGVAALGGMFVAGAEGGVPLEAGLSATKGISVTALLNNIPLMVGILSVGAAAGAIYDVSNHRDAVQEELAKSRQMMRELRGIVRDQQIGQERAHEHTAGVSRQQVEHDFDSMGEISHGLGQQQWAERTRQREQNRLAALQAQAETPDDTMKSAVAREEARRGQRRYDARSK